MARSKKIDGKRMNFLLSGDRVKKLRKASEAKQKDMTAIIEDLIDTLEDSNVDIGNA